MLLRDRMIAPPHGGCTPPVGVTRTLLLMLKEFKAFVMRGNVLDLAIAVILGAAFGKIVT
jgi:hypothetical protein